MEGKKIYLEMVHHSEPIVKSLQEWVSIIAESDAHKNALKNHQSIAAVGPKSICAVTKDGLVIITKNYQTQFDDQINVSRIRHIEYNSDIRKFMIAYKEKIQIPPNLFIMSIYADFVCLFGDKYLIWNSEEPYDIDIYNKKFEHEKSFKFRYMIKKVRKIDENTIGLITNNDVYMYDTNMKLVHSVNIGQKSLIMIGPGKQIISFSPYHRQFISINRNVIYSCLEKGPIFTTCLRTPDVPKHILLGCIWVD